MNIANTGFEYFGVVTLLIMKMMPIERWMSMSRYSMATSLAVARWVVSFYSFFHSVALEAGMA